MTIDELERRFQLLLDPTLRYQYIIQLGRKLPPLPDEEHVDDNLVRGELRRGSMTSREFWLRTSESMPFKSVLSARAMTRFRFLPKPARRWVPSCSPVRCDRRTCCHPRLSARELQPEFAGRYWSRLSLPSR